MSSSSPAARREAASIAPSAAAANSGSRPMSLRAADACTVTTDRACPTLSWISRAIRLRSAARAASACRRASRSAEDGPRSTGPSRARNRPASSTPSKVAAAAGTVHQLPASAISPSTAATASAPVNTCSRNQPSVRRRCGQAVAGPGGPSPNSTASKLCAATPSTCRTAGTRPTSSGPPTSAAPSRTVAHTGAPPSATRERIVKSAMARASASAEPASTNTARK